MYVKFLPGFCAIGESNNEEENGRHKKWYEFGEEEVNVRLDFLCENLHGAVLVGQMTEPDDLEHVDVFLRQTKSPEVMEVDECEQDNDQEESGIGPLPRAHPVDPVGVVHGDEDIHGDYDHHPWRQILDEADQEGVHLTGSIGHGYDVVAKGFLIHGDVPVIPTEDAQKNQVKDECDGQKEAAGPHYVAEPVQEDDEGQSQEGAEEQEQGVDIRLHDGLHAVNAPLQGRVVFNQEPICQVQCVVPII